MKVVVYDPSLEAGDVVVKFLEHFGHQVNYFSDRPLALKALQNGEADLLVLDLPRRPEAEKDIVNLAKEKGFKVVAMSAWGDEAAELIVQMGFDAFLMKPFHIEDLEKAIAEL